MTSGTRSLAFALGALILLTRPGAAAKIVEGDLPGGTGGVPYAWQVVLSGPGDAAEIAGGVGSKAWAEPSNPGLGSFGLPAGWTHWSVWVHLRLPVDGPVRVTLSADDAVPDGEGGFLDGDLVPAFTLWSGADNDGPDDHFYEQGETPHWIDAPGFAYLAHDDAGPGPFADAIAEVALELPAGAYTLALGGHDETTSAHRAGYRLSVAAPEPAAPLLLLAGAAALRAARRPRARPATTHRMPRAARFG
jgi:hypothetical protein